MTGFGGGEAATSQWRVTAELSGVNRKQIDIAVGLPQSISAMEPEVRKLIAGQISRGRVNARISLSNQLEQKSVLAVDFELARQYLESAREIASQADLDCDLTVSDLFRAPGLFKIEETPVEMEEVENLVREALLVALLNLEKMQTDEGQHLRNDLQKRIEIIEEEIVSIENFSREVVEKYRESLLNRLSESGLEVDLEDERVLREIALYAERCDITEEITRIESHIVQFRNYFTSDEPVGRPLDFLCQELNRELNTIGSKANHAAIAQSVVVSKTELEKIREQVQNVQ